MLFLSGGLLILLINAAYGCKINEISILRMDLDAPCNSPKKSNMGMTINCKNVVQANCDNQITPAASLNLRFDKAVSGKTYTLLIIRSLAETEYLEAAYSGITTEELKLGKTIGGTKNADYKGNAKYVLFEENPANPFYPTPSSEKQFKAAQLLTDSNICSVAGVFALKLDAK